MDHTIRQENAEPGGTALHCTAACRVAQLSNNLAAAGANRGKPIAGDEREMFFAPIPWRSWLSCHHGSDAARHCSPGRG
eukprot:CAMPEP_0197927820 /NCGR_PEP_ID=MMETSP1439-20131203/101338_2 /TAXON_ID=66791 /ORGANISM="Gonyaulax spinifera, Strain CCMP409" /LENGTH=78 /DNA_ID=CAMNT_0043550409 /DNA_START=37 /DNA_END=270 /DNA_ORIENTATION=-